MSGWLRCRRAAARGRVAVMLAGSVSACGGGGHDGDVAAAAVVDHRVVCGLLTRLDRAGTTVATANVADVVAFDAALAGAVHDYTRVLDALDRVVPRDLRAHVTRLRA